MLSGGQISAFFCSERDHKPQNSGCSHTAQRFHTAWGHCRRVARADVWRTADGSSDSKENGPPTIAGGGRGAGAVGGEVSPRPLVIGGWGSGEPVGVVAQLRSRLISRPEGTRGSSPTRSGSTLDCDLCEDVPAQEGTGQDVKPEKGTSGAGISRHRGRLV